MAKIANHDSLIAAVLSDRRGGGGRVPLGWMRSFLKSRPLLEPEHFTSAKVLMVHPAKDR